MSGVQGSNLIGRKKVEEECKEGSGVASTLD